MPLAADFGLAAGMFAREAAFRGDGDPLVIGLVNNMPDAEFRTTEQQFRRLLAAAAPPGGEVRLRLLTRREDRRSVGVA